MKQYDISRAAYYCAAQKIFGNHPSVGIAVIDHFDGVENLFNLSEKELRDLSRLVPECRKISPKIVEKSFKELEDFEHNSIIFLCYLDSCYPAMLMGINNYPIGIYIQTNTSLESLLNRSKFLGVIGGKDPYSYGIKSCQSIIESLIDQQSNIGIISRQTSGIDKLILELASSHGIPSIGVLPYALSKMPASLRDDLSKQSPEVALLTDIPPGEVKSNYCFLRRSRIISALSRAILLVESKGSDSCDQIIENAFSYGKEVWTFPGPVDWDGYKYNNKLIRINIAEMIFSYADLKEKIQRL